MANERHRFDNPACALFNLVILHQEPADGYNGMSRQRWLFRIDVTIDRVDELVQRGIVRCPLNSRKLDPHDSSLHNEQIFSGTIVSHRPENIRYAVAIWEAS